MNEHREKAPIVVIGAGIIGLLCAWYLTKYGKSVMVVDRQNAGRESSWAGGGILSPLYPHRYPSILPLVRRSADLYPDLAREVAELTSIDPELIASGLLILDPPVSTTTTAECGQTNEVTESLTSVALRSVEPNLVFPGGGMRHRDASQIRAPRLIAGLQRGLSLRGVKFKEHEAVTNFHIAGGRLRGVQTERGVIDAAQCIVATGAWAGVQLRATGIDLPVEPVRGQMIVVKGPPRHLRHMIVYQYRYLIPRRDGRVLVGSTVERVGYDNATTPQARDALHGFALSLVPSLAEFPIEHQWAGLRPGTPDDAPYIGVHPNISGLFVCAGHHRNGFATGPASAKLVVDLMLARAPQLDPTPYRLDRPPVPWHD